jgi:RimJ/RimL family protein N-acetyltransferase
VLEKAGFELESTTKSAYIKQGQYLDGLTYALVRKLPPSTHTTRPEGS